MNAIFDRRHLLRLALGLVGLTTSAGPAAGSVTRGMDDSPEDTYVWRPTDETRCNAGLVEERWCYYECAGGVCTPLQYEWRQTTRPC